MLIPISLFTALGFYVWTIFGLPKIMLPKQYENNFGYSEFKREYPNGKLLVTIHNILSIIIFTSAFVLGGLVGNLFFKKEYNLVFGIWICVAGWNLYNGIFEVTTKVSPTYGIVIKRQSNQSFKTGNLIRKLGFIRIGISIFIISTIFSIRYLFPKVIN